MLCVGNVNIRMVVIFYGQKPYRQSHHGAKGQQRNLSNIILRPTEAVRKQTENVKATPGLGLRSNAEERLRWRIYVKRIKGLTGVTVQEWTR